MNSPSPMERWAQGQDLPDIWQQQKRNPPQRAASISQGEPVGLELRGTEMKDFPKPVPLRLKEQFYDIRVLYSQSLCDFISRGKGDPGNISMKLKYLGPDSQNTELYIVIQCEKRVAKRVKKFFAQKHVEEDLLPDFRVFVLDKPPIEVANDDTIDVLIDSLPLKTMCGMAVTLSGGGKSVRCTLGGVIIVETDQKRLYGLIAGNPLKKIRVDVSGKQPAHEAHGSSASASEDEEEDSDDASTTLPKSAHPDIERTNDDSILRTKLHVGTVAYDSFSIPSDENCDWALIDLNQESALSNVVIRNEQPADINSEYYEDEIHRYCGNSLCTTLTEEVLVLKQDKPSIAELSFNTSPLMMSPGSRFVSAHDIKMKDGSCPGDSGLWVVDENTSRLYGHVVSVDAFGEAQVMPIQSTLKSIKSQLKASRAFLATALAVNKLKADLKESRSSIVPGPTAPVSNLNLGSIARSE
ncbi:unnamed protein product [Fusarium graminearum]|nr:unnamed protein product [Fusarium graminearum]